MEKQSDLGLIGELNNEATNREWRLIGVIIVNAFGSHVTGEDTTIGGETGDGDTDVIINLEDLLLV